MKSAEVFKKEDVFNMAEPNKAKDALDDLLAELDDVEIQSMLPKILQHSAAFYRYSPRNQLLLALQAQRRGFTPSLVGGFNTWKSYGRFAAKGSKGLNIYVPAGASKKITAEVGGVQREYFSVKAVPKGARIVSETESGMRYRIATVFDVSQTAGDPMPELSQFIAPTSSANSEQLLEHLTKYIEDKGWEVEFSPEQQGLAGGYANHADKKITVGSWEPIETQLATLAHEAGHMIRHTPEDKLGGNYHTSIEARGYAELEAEGIALAFLAAHGIDHSAGAAQYMAGWAEAARQVELVNIAGSGESKPITRQDALLTVTGRILETTKQMLEAIKPAGVGGRLEWNAKLEPGQKTPAPEILTTVKPVETALKSYAPEKRANAQLGENLTTLAETSGRHPEELITIYRGVPADVDDLIVPGDFVTTNQQLAKKYAGTGKIVTQEVRYGDVLNDRTEPGVDGGEEFIYRPDVDKELSKKLVEQSLQEFEIVVETEIETVTTFETRGMSL